MEVREIPLGSIAFGERGREEYGNIEELAANIQEFGLLQPITVSKAAEDKDYLLIAGGRRLRAHEMLELETIPCVIRDVKNQANAKELELIENVYRDDLTWTERCKMELELTRVSGLSTTDLAKDIGVSRSLLYRNVQLGEALEAIPALAKCKTAKEAEKVLNQTQQKMVAAELANRAEAVKAGLDPNTGISDEELLTLAKDKSMKQSGKKQVEDHRLTQALKDYTIGECIEAMSQTEPQEFDFAEVDPPYAIDLLKAKRVEGAGGPVEDYKEENPNAYGDFLYALADEVFVKLKPHSYAIFWFGPTHQEVTKRALISAGFNVNDVPGIWTKRTGQTQQPKTNLANCYEPFYICRKGKAELTKQGRSNVFAFGGVHGPDKIHPTERPIDLMMEILATFAQPAQSVLIPFLGSGVTLRAVYKSGMYGKGWDLTEEYRNAFLLKIRDDIAEEFKSDDKTDNTGTANSEGSGEAGEGDKDKK